MNSRLMVIVLVAPFLGGASATGQVADDASPKAERYVDRVGGLSLGQAVARAIEKEPSLRAARHGVDAARGLQLQSGLRPNPAFAFEQRQEPGGSGNQTTVAVEWPLDLFRKDGRTAVASRELTSTELSVSDRERLLAAEVRVRYGEAVAAVRDLEVLDEIVAVAARQHDLLRSRVLEGASPPLDRDLFAVELKRLESERLLQVGRTEAALVELERWLGDTPGAPLRLSDTLESLVEGDVPPEGGPSGETVTVRQRADVREAESRIGVADARIDLAERNGRFDVSLFASYMRMNNGFPQQGFAADGSLAPISGVFHNLAGGARVTVPLRNRNQGEVAAARAGRAAAVAVYEAASLTAQAEVGAARARDEYSRQAVSVYSGETRTLARQNLMVLRQSYELGRASVLDVLAEQRRYLDVERGYTEALRAAYEARTALRRALGEVR